MPFAHNEVPATETTFVTVPAHKKLRPTSIIIHNKDSADRVITGTIVFTPSRSYKVSSPAEQTKTWLEVKVAAGAMEKISAEQIGGTELFGEVKFKSDNVSSTPPVLTMHYELV